MKKIFSLLLVSFILIFMFGLIGCGSSKDSVKGDPSKILEDYYSNIKKGNYELAYDVLTDMSKKNSEKNDFIECLRNDIELETLKSTEVKEKEKYKNQKIEGIMYKDIIEFDVTENIHNNYKNEDVSAKCKRYMVNDNGEWKIYRAKEDGKAMLADSMNNLAWMYIEGKGKNKDVKQGAVILEKAVKIDPEYNDTYYALAYTYCLLGKYDESINDVNKYINKASKNADKAKGYNVLGLGYESNKDYTNAKKYYSQAIQTDAAVNYADSNLKRVNEIIEAKTGAKN